MTLGEVVRLESANQELRDRFLLWQCRVRQMITREKGGKPDDGIMPEIRLADASAPLGQIITVLCKRAEYSKVPELKQIVRGTFDPAVRRKKALSLFNESYYQKAQEFSDVLCSTFPPESQGARQIRQARNCTLEFGALNQRYTLHCRIWRLSEHNPLWQATYWHNILFNPALPADTLVLGFEPDWSRSIADPMPGSVG